MLILCLFVHVSAHAVCVVTAGPAAGGQLTLNGSGTVTLGGMVLAGTIRVSSVGGTYNLNRLNSSATSAVLTTAASNSMIFGVGCNLAGAFTGPGQYQFSNARAVGPMSFGGGAQISLSSLSGSQVITVQTAAITFYTFGGSNTWSGPGVGHTFTVAAAVLNGISDMAGSLVLTGSVTVGTLSTAVGSTLSILGANQLTINGGVLRGQMNLNAQPLVVANAVITAAADFGGSAAAVIRLHNSKLSSNVTIPAEYSIEVHTNSTLGVFGAFGSPHHYKSLSLKAGAFASFDQSGTFRVGSLNVTAPTGLTGSNSIVTTRASFEMHSPVVMQQVRIVSTGPLDITLDGTDSSILMSAGSSITTFGWCISD